VAIAPIHFVPTSGDIVEVDGLGSLSDNGIGRWNVFPCLPFELLDCRFTYLLCFLATVRNLLSGVSLALIAFESVLFLQPSAIQSVAKRERFQHFTFSLTR